MKKRTKGKRLLAAALSILLAVNTMTMPAFAKGQTDQGLCDHHQEHTEDCGYRKAQPCIHEHTNACYTDDLICSYIVDEENIASDSDTEHTHTQECYALDCPHEQGEHDDGCGYEKAAPCSYACAECAATDSDASTIMITAFEDLEDRVKVQTVPYGTPRNSLELPDTLGAFGYPVDNDTKSAPEPKAVTIENVTWELTGEDNSPTEYEEERVTSCTFYFQAVLPEGYDLAGIAVLPQIEVRYGWDYRMAGLQNQAPGYTFDPDTGHLTISSRAGMENAAWQDPATGLTRSIISVEIADSITIIPGNTFQNCPNLTTITLPANLIEIRPNAFENCRELTLDALPDTVEIIGISAFMGCEKLALTSLPSSIKRISGHAFNGCESISSLTFTGPNAPKLDKDAFINTTFPIYVPEDGIGYNTDEWANYSNRVTFGAALSSLTISSGDLAPRFDPNETSYTVSVGSGTDVITVTPTFYGSGTITVNEKQVTSGEESDFLLAVGETKISIVVTTVNGDSRTYNIDVTRAYAAVTGVTLDQSSYTLYTNKDPKNFKLAATVWPADASDTAVIWDSSDENVAAVSADGTVNAVAPGTTTITAATKDGSKTASCSVTVVKAVTGVTLDRSSYALYTNKDPMNFKLTATVQPADASDTAVIWDSSDKNVATVEQDGTVNAVAPGTATITAATKDGSKTASCSVTVVKAVTGIALDRSSYTLYTNKDPMTFKLAATVRPADASDTAVIWKSSNENVAAVEQDGTVNSIAPGTAIITVTTNDGGKTATCTVTVRKAVTGITLDQSSYTLYTNKDPNAFKLTATVQPADAFDTTVRWESSNTAVATVDVDGTINAVAPGNATITAITNDGGKTASCSVTVRTYFSSGGNDDSDDSNAYSNPDHLHGTWIQTDTGNWIFRQASGAYVKNRWGMVDGQWYYFDAEGKMLTGWQFLNGQWYYLYTKEDAAAKAGIKEGAMASGWHFDPTYQKWFYLDTNGAMVTGWREINGKWYYFNPVSDGTRGCMVTDFMVDGWYIDKDGIRNGSEK